MIITLISTIKENLLRDEWSWGLYGKRDQVKPFREKYSWGGRHRTGWPGIQDYFREEG